VIRHHLHLFIHLIDPAAHEPLDREDGVLRIGHRLPLGDLPHQTLSSFGEGHHRRRQTSAFGVGDDNRLSTFHHGDNRIGCPEVDPDDFAHSVTSISRSGHTPMGDNDPSIKVE